MTKYIYGIKRPGKERMSQIKVALHQIGKELMAV